MPEQTRSSVTDELSYDDTAWIAIAIEILAAASAAIFAILQAR